MFTLSLLQPMLWHMAAVKCLPVYGHSTDFVFCSLQLIIGLILSQLENKNLLKFGDRGANSPENLPSKLILNGYEICEWNFRMEMLMWLVNETLMMSLMMTIFVFRCPHGVLGGIWDWIVLKLRGFLLTFVFNFWQFDRLHRFLSTYKLQIIA